MPLLLATKSVGLPRRLQLPRAKKLLILELERNFETLAALPNECCSKYGSSLHSKHYRWEDLLPPPCIMTVFIKKACYFASYRDSYAYLRTFSQT